MLVSAARIRLHLHNVAFSSSLSGVDGEEGEGKSIFGFATSGIKVGNGIASILSCPDVLVLRLEGDHHVLVGTASVPGFDEMEAIKGLKSSSELLRDFFLK